MVWQGNGTGNDGLTFEAGDASADDDDYYYVKRDSPQGAQVGLCRAI
jgi:hypothetical protein